MAKHASEVPGAAVAVARHLMNPETRGATYEGLVEGGTEGRTAALQQGLKQGAMELGGRGAGAALRGTSAGLKTINASPVARKYGLTWKNLVPAVGALAGGAGGGGLGAGGGAIAGRALSSPQTFNALTGLLDQAGKKLPIADLLRALDAYRNRPNPEEEP